MVVAERWPLTLFRGDCSSLLPAGSYCFGLAAKNRHMISLAFMSCVG